MPTKLATELLQHIVELLAEGPRAECLQALIACSTASSALLYASQKYIFRSLVLYTDLKGTEYHQSLYGVCGEISHGIHAGRDRTNLLLLRTLSRSPRLSLYVRDLILRCGRSPSRSDPFALRIICQL